MNPALFTAFLRQRAGSPIRLVLAAFLTLPALAIAIYTESLGPIASSAWYLAFVFAAGAIGQDVSSGVLQLTFARPVTRPAYVFSRWLAAGTLAVVLANLQLFAGAALIAARGNADAALGAWPMALEYVVRGYTTAALMVMLSTFVGGLGDLGLYALALFGASLLGSLAQFKHWTRLAWIADQLDGTLDAHVSFAWLAGAGSPRVGDLVTALSTSALALAIAVAVMNRKELSYASG